jgi:S-DNA-T family DNA segregation ATPase FtsK/SpoIIIE
MATTVETCAMILVSVCLVVAVALPMMSRSCPRAAWVLFGYPVALLRVLLTWRRLTTFCDLAVARRQRKAALVRGDMIVKGDPLRPSPPFITWPWPTVNGFRFRLRMHPGQVPEDYIKASLAMAHTWHVHSVRVVSPARGWLRVVAVAKDPLSQPLTARSNVSADLLHAVVGVREDGQPWTVDFRRLPHWLIVGATQSGKSTLINALVCELAPQPVALVGIDCKGGVELSLYEPRLSALATTKREASAVLAGLVELAAERMRLCRRQQVRNIWELPDWLRPMPVVTIVDEVAELFLSATREEKAESTKAATLIIRLAQLGRALGLYLVVAGQRVGSELGPGVTALRAQLGGRICHRVNDAETAVMALGDLNPDALVAAQSIGADEPGVAVTADETGGWQRARSTNIPPAFAEVVTQQYATHAIEIVEITAELNKLPPDANGVDGRAAA